MNMSTKWMVCCVVVMVIIGAAETGIIKLRAKKILDGKVVGAGYSVPSSSLEQCLAMCNKRRGSCDGIVYHQVISKCRLINKCAETKQVDNSTDFVYYSKRPQIRDSGYVHEPKTDSCLKVMTEEMAYKDADMRCYLHHGQLAVIENEVLNAMASVVINETDGAHWAWIGDSSSGTQDTGRHIGNNVESEPPFTPEVLLWRNSSMKNCWAMNSNGQWGQFSCKKEKLFALCQVPMFMPYELH